MSTSKKLVFALFLVTLGALLPSSTASADGGRYFVKSTKAFWKNTLGVRHSFENGFSTELSDFQVRFARIFGAEIEPVRVLQILPEEIAATAPEVKEVKSEVKTADEPLEQPSATPSPAKVTAPKSRAKPRPVPSDQTPWGIEVVYNDGSIVKTSGGEGVNVVVLDTGILTSHLDLKNRIGQCKDFTNPRTPIIDGKCEDKNGHGTHVAGIIAADGGADSKGIYGVAPAAKLFIYKVCGPNGSCYADDIAAAIRLAADQDAQVINMSFGADSEIPLINDAINYAVSKNVLPVAAAGNDGPFADSIDYPGAYATVVAAGAINQTIAVTEWSSRGINSTTTPYVVENRDIEFATPGENIESTYNNGGYAILSGTSMSSPFAAGLAAKFWQAAAENPAHSARAFL